MHHIGVSNVFSEYRCLFIRSTHILRTSHDKGVIINYMSGQRLRCVCGEGGGEIKQVYCNGMMLKTTLTEEIVLLQLYW